jgi:hypothetical protein
MSNTIKPNKVINKKLRLPNPVIGRLGGSPKMQGSTNFIQSQNHILDRKFDLAEKNLLFVKHKLPNMSCTVFSPYFSFSL